MLTYKSERVLCVHLWIIVNVNEHRDSSNSTSIHTISERSLVRNMVMKFGLTSQAWKWNISDSQHTVASFPIVKDALFLNTVSQTNVFIKESHSHSLCLSHRYGMVTINAALACNTTVIVHIMQTTMKHYKLI